LQSILRRFDMTQLLRICGTSGERRQAQNYQERDLARGTPPIKFGHEQALAGTQFGFRHLSLLLRARRAAP
jgi:hypothetical protein